MFLNRIHVKIYVETKKAKKQQEQERGCGSNDAMIISVVFYFIKNNCSKGPGLVAAAAGGNRRVELVCSGCLAVSENGVWVINKPESVEVQTRHRVEDDRDESTRMKCSGKSAAAGHKGREKNSRGGGEVRTARKAGDRFLCDGGKPSPSLPEKTAESLLLFEYLTLREIKTRYSTVLY